MDRFYRIQGAIPDELLVGCRIEATSIKDDAYVGTSPKVFDGGFGAALGQLSQHLRSAAVIVPLRAASGVKDLYVGYSRLLKIAPGQTRRKCSVQGGGGRGLRTFQMYCLISPPEAGCDIVLAQERETRVAFRAGEAVAVHALAQIPYGFDNRDRGAMCVMEVGVFSKVATPPGVRPKGALLPM